MRIDNPRTDEEIVELNTNAISKIIKHSRARVKKEGAVPASELRRRLGLEK
jgi:hypothetical protein